ncbi:MAG: hypothetical protein H7Y17_17065 [Chlorobia bacterium]|nr:hypothetical protein [Fimbriimonadaceae bacterium]
MFSKIRKWKADRLAADDYFTRFREGPVGTWTNSGEGVSMAPTDGDVVFLQDGTGEIAVWMGVCCEFLWKSTGDHRIQVWLPSEPTQVVELAFTFYEKTMWIDDGQVVERRADRSSEESGIIDLAETLSFHPWTLVEA